MENIKAIIFDVDGLLADTEKYYTKTWQQALEALGQKISDEEMLSFRGYNWKIVREKLIKKYNEELADKAVAKREELLLEHIENGDIKAKPYAMETLKWGKEHGYKLAIASAGKKSRAKRIVEMLGFMPYFEHTTFGDDVERKDNKPEPGPYLRAMNALNVNEHEAVAVEDSLVGATSATKAGLPVILIPDQSLPVKDYTKEQLEGLNILTKGTDLRIVLETLSK